MAKRWWGALALGVLAATAWAGGDASAQQSVTVVSWGGNYTKNQAASFFEPFTKETGIRVKSEDWNGNLGQIRAQVEAKKATWDVVVGEVAFAKKGCDEGFLERINPAILPAGPNGEAPGQDFLPGTVMPCAVGSVIWAYALGYDPARTGGQAPASWADFFDTRKFPGKRGMMRRPESTLEFALLADGVPAGEVYKVLGTKEGLDRAFRKLDTIKKDIVWWESFAQPPQLLNDGEVVMTTASAQRLIQPIVEDKKPWKVVFDGMIWDMDVWMVVKGAPNPKQALEFVSFASRPDRVADLATRAAYGPVRSSAVPLVGANPATGTDMKPYIVSNPEVLKRGIQMNSDFWADNLDDIKERFNAWLARN